MPDTVQSHASHNWTGADTHIEAGIILAAMRRIVGFIQKWLP